MVLLGTMLQYYEPGGELPRHIPGKADEDGYTGFPRTAMYLAGGEIFAEIAPDYEKPFFRCGVRDCAMQIRPGMFRARPAFTFLPESREGERETVEDIRAFFGGRWRSGAAPKEGHHI